jgi:hypothetical protein
VASLELLKLCASEIRQIASNSELLPMMAKASFFSPDRLWTLRTVVPLKSGLPPYSGALRGVQKIELSEVIQSKNSQLFASFGE